MQLPEEDEEYLGQKGYVWELVPDGNGGCLILKQYRLAIGKYDVESVDLMIRLPDGYNNSKLDMFYVDPPVKLKATGDYPDRARDFVQAAGRKWQQFSRHVAKWRPGVDRLCNYMPLVNKELQTGP